MSNVKDDFEEFGKPPESKNTKTPQQIREEQRTDAAKAAARAQPAGTNGSTAVVPIEPLTSMVVPQDARPYRERYLDAVAPLTFPGRLFKFSKGEFLFTDDGTEVPADRDYTVLPDQVLMGWIKFNRDGGPPERHQGLWIDNYVLPPRDSLDELDRAQWEMGLDGKPADPWQHQMMVVMEDRSNNELLTFGTTSITGRAAVGNLLRHYERLQKRYPGHVPVVRLKSATVKHKKDPRVGTYDVPVFAIFGHAEADTNTIPDTSLKGDMGDEIPF